MKNRKDLLVATFAVVAVLFAVGLALGIAYEFVRPTVEAKREPDSRDNETLKRRQDQTLALEAKREVDSLDNRPLQPLPDQSLMVESEHEADSVASGTLQRRQDQGTAAEVKRDADSHDSDSHNDGTAQPRPDQATFVESERKGDPRPDANQTAPVTPSARPTEGRPLSTGSVAGAVIPLRGPSTSSVLGPTDALTTRDRSDRARAPAASDAAAAKIQPSQTTDEVVLFTEPEARLALYGVGVDPFAEAVWISAINDPNIQPGKRRNLIEDLNEDGFRDHRNITSDDLPLIASRMMLIEDLFFDAMDEVNAEAFLEAYKDLEKMYERLSNE